MKVVLLDTIYKRLEDGIYFDDDMLIYSFELISSMLDVYENSEDYEKCVFLKKLLTERFSHEDLYNQTDMKTNIKELLDLSKNAPKKMFKELELIFCNCNLDSSKRKDLIDIINRNIFNPNVGK